MTNDTDDFDDGFGKVGAILRPYAYSPVWQEVSPVHAEIAVDAAGEDCGAKDVAMLQGKSVVRRMWRWESCRRMGLVESRQRSFI